MTKNEIGFTKKFKKGFTTNTRKRKEQARKQARQKRRVVNSKPGKPVKKKSKKKKDLLKTKDLHKGLKKMDKKLLGETKTRNKQKKDSTKAFKFQGKPLMARTIKPFKRQTGKRKDLLKDKKRKSLKPGKRISKNGNVYWETRKNRSDLKGKKI